MSGVEGRARAFELVRQHICWLKVRAECLRERGEPGDANNAEYAEDVAAALSAVEGGGGALQPSASAPTEPVADRWADLERLAKAYRDADFNSAANPAAILELIAAARRDEEAGQ